MSVSEGNRTFVMSTVFCETRTIGDQISLFGIESIDSDMFSYTMPFNMD